MKKFFDRIMSFGVRHFADGDGGGTPAPAAGTPAPEIPVGQAPPAGAPEGTPKPDTAGGQPAAKPLEDEVFDWAKDERYKRMWNKDGTPFTEQQLKVINDGLFKSYRNLEKVHEPTKQELSQLKTQFDSLNKVAKEYGISLEQISDILNEHKSFKDPANPVNQRAGYLSEWVDNPIYRDKVIAFFQDLEKQEEQRRYPNMSAEQIKQMRAMETEIAQIKADNQKKSHEQMVNKFSTEIKSNIDKAKKFAEIKGFDFTDDIKNSLLEHCEKNNIPTSLVYATFIDLYNEELDKAHTAKVQNEQLKNLNKNKKDGILPAGTKPDAGGGSENLLNKLRQKILKK